MKKQLLLTVTVILASVFISVAQISDQNNLISNANNFFKAINTGIDNFPQIVFQPKQFKSTFSSIVEESASESLEMPIGGNLDLSDFYTTTVGKDIYGNNKTTFVTPQITKRKTLKSESDSSAQITILNGSSGQTIIISGIFKGTMSIYTFKGKKIKLPDGEGEFVSSDKSIKYTGAWKDGSFNGTGTLSVSKLNIKGVTYNPFNYKGAFVNGKREGAGSLTVNNNSGKLLYQYEGSWKNDVPSGAGKMSYGGIIGTDFNGNYFYNGNWENGMRSGFGELTADNRYFFAFGNDLIEFHKFSGNWANDAVNSPGPAGTTTEGVYLGHYVDLKTNKSDSVNVLIGSWIGDKFSGSCVLKPTTGMIGTYRGKILNGKKEGSFTFTDQKSNSLICQYKSDNCISAEGTLYFLDQNADAAESWSGLYKGTFQNTLDIFSENFSGKGKYQADNGSFIDGEWVNGKFTGKLRYIYIMGSIEATVTNGKNAFGTIDNQPAYTYEGSFEINSITQKYLDYTLTGKGKYFSPMDGFEIDGEFVNDRFNWVGVYTGENDCKIEITSMTLDGTGFNYTVHIPENEWCGVGTYNGTAKITSLTTAEGRAADDEEFGEKFELRSGNILNFEPNLFYIGNECARHLPCYEFKRR